jgi:hypothetical protein
MANGLVADGLGLTAYNLKLITYSLSLVAWGGKRQMVRRGSPRVASGKWFGAAHHGWQMVRRGSPRVASGE